MSRLLSSSAFLVAVLFLQQNTISAQNSDFNNPPNQWFLSSHWNHSSTFHVTHFDQNSTNTNDTRKISSFTNRDSGSHIEPINPSPNQRSALRQAADAPQTQRALTAQQLISIISLLVPGMRPPSSGLLGGLPVRQDGPPPAYLLNGAPSPAAANPLLQALLPMRGNVGGRFDS